MGADDWYAFQRRAVMPHRGAMNAGLASRRRLFPAAGTCHDGRRRVLRRHTCHARVSWPHVILHEEFAHMLSAVASLLSHAARPDLTLWRISANVEDTPRYFLARAAE